MTKKKDPILPRLSILGYGEPLFWALQELQVDLRKPGGAWEFASVRGGPRSRSPPRTSGPKRPHEHKDPNIW